MNEKDLSAQPNGSGIVDVGAAMAGRNADPHKIKLPNPITGEQIEAGEDEEAEAQAPQVAIPALSPSHLEGFKLPDKLPTCLKESFALLANIDKLPEDSIPRQKSKARLLSIIKKHCFDLQQGLPILNMTSDDQGSHEHREAIYLENQIKQLALTVPPVKRLLEDYEKLKAQISALAEENAKLKKKK